MAIGGGTGGALLLLAGIAWLLLRGGIAGPEKLDWQLKASDSDPPDHCTRGQRICHRECEFDPAPRHITEIACNREPSTDHALTLKGDAVDRLNDAHAAYRKGQREDAAAHIAAAESLISDAVTAWLRGTPSNARLDATIEGSTGSCDFKLLRCAEGERPSWLTRARRLLGLEKDDHPPWQEIAHWKAEIKDSRTVEVCVLDSSLLADPSRRPDLSTALRQQLSALIQNWNETASNAALTARRSTRPDGQLTPPEQSPR